MKILIVSSNEGVARCVKLACEAGLAHGLELTHKVGSVHDLELACGAKSELLDSEVVVVKDALTAMNEIDKEVPRMIFFEVFLVGISGVNFLNELIMDERMAKTALVLMVDNDMEIAGAEEYGIVRILNLEKMRPQEVVGLVKRYVK